MTEEERYSIDRRLEQDPVLALLALREAIRSPLDPVPT